MRFYLGYSQNSTFSVFLTRERMIWRKVSPGSSERGASPACNS